VEAQGWRRWSWGTEERRPWALRGHRTLDL